MEDCLIHSTFPFNQMMLEINSWNNLFLYIKFGTFILTRTQFDKIINAGCVISVLLRSGKKITFDQCEFSGSGNLDDNGNVICVASDIIMNKEIAMVIITNSRFLRCYGYNGGVFRCDFLNIITAFCVHIDMIDLLTNTL
jgi:hypothetical protein